MIKLHSSFAFLTLFLLQGCTDFGESVYPRHEEQRIVSDIQSDWSPDGQWIVYRHEDYYSLDSAYPSGIYVIDSAGYNRSLLIMGEARSPAWSPDGRFIAFSAGAIFLLKVDSDSIAQLTSYAGSFPRWSPDGTEIVFGRSGTIDTVGLWIIDIVSNSQRRYGYGGNPDWSPDGLEFVITGSVSTYLLGVAKKPVANPSIISVLVSGVDAHRGARWSPDGQEIAWCVYLAGEGGGQEVWIMNSAGANKRKLTNGIDPAWSPDGQTIVFSSFDSSKDKQTLWKIGANGQNLRQLTF